MKKHASAVWTGSLKEGKGTLDTMRNWNTIEKVLS